MPRNKHRRERARGADSDREMSLEHLLVGWRRTESRRGGTWNVQPVSPAQAVKSYACPGCSRAIDPGTAHLVTWRDDGVLGDDADLAARRHWHTHCWKIA